MKAWGKSLDADKSSGIRFLADPAGKFTKAWDVDFDASGLLGNYRSKRYAVAVENGKVVKASVEPDNVGISGKSYHDLSLKLQIWTSRAITNPRRLCCRQVLVEYSYRTSHNMM